MPTDPREWSEDECWKWLAEDAGWHWHSWGNGGGGWSRHKDYRKAIHEHTHRHPLTERLRPSLDDAIRAIPEGWTWELSKSYWWTDLSGKDQHENKLGFTVVGTSPTKTYHDEGRSLWVNFSETAELAMFRLAVLCRMAAKKGPTDGK